MRNNRTLICILMAALLSCGTALTACGASPTATPAQTDPTPAGTTADTAAPAETERTYQNLADTDFGGETVTFLLRQTPDDWSADDVVVDETDGTPINDAVYARNAQVEEDFNVKIVGVNAPTGHSVYTPAYNSIMAGDNAYDVIVGYRYDGDKLMLDNTLIDLNTTPHLQLDEPWWNPFYNEGTSFMNRQYYALGDISRVYKLGVRCLFFNKDLAAQLDMENLYDAVRNNEWTVDKMFTLASQAVADLNGDGLMNENDRYGIQAQTSLPNMLAFASDVQISDKDENDIPILVLNSDRNISILDGVSAFYDTYEKTIYECNEWAVTQTRFSENLALFQAEVMLLIEALRASEVNIGILPMPKYDSSQENYISFLDSWCQNVYAIPVTCEKTDAVSFTLEAMAQASVDTLSTAFYDVCLTGKYVRDNESEEMLDIIFANCRSESAESVGWGDILTNLRTSIEKGNVASIVAAKMKSTQKALDNTVSRMKENIESAE